MYFDGEIRISISDSNDIDENVNKKIGLEPTVIIKKGEHCTSNQKATHNIWSYELKFCDTNFSLNLESFTLHLSKFSDNIKNLVIDYESVEINIYIRTLYGQFGFSILNKELNKLSLIGLDVGFHILSYGEVAK